MESEQQFFICPFCFRVCESEDECHRHKMVACHVGGLIDERRRPVLDRFGKILSRAPRWYLEATGHIRPPIW